MLKEYRGQKISMELLKKAEEIVYQYKGKYIMLHVQIQAQQFYEKQEYLSYGGIEYDKNCLYIWMLKKIIGFEQ